MWSRTSYTHSGSESGHCRCYRHRCQFVLRVLQAVLQRSIPLPMVITATFLLALMLGFSKRYSKIVNTNLPSLIAVWRKQQCRPPGISCFIIHRCTDCIPDLCHYRCSFQLFYFNSICSIWYLFILIQISCYRFDRTIFENYAFLQTCFFGLQL